MTARRVLIGAAVALLIAYGLTGVTLVRPGERAVVRRFGRVLAHKPEPGLWVGLPWGLDRVDRVPVDRVQEVTVGYLDGDAQPAPPGQLLTGDHNLVNVRAVVTWKVRPEEVGDYLANADRVDGLIARVAEAVLAEWVGGREVDDVLLNAKTVLRPVLVAGTQERLGPYGLGVEVLDARIALAAPPDEVKPAFDSVARAQTQISTAVNRAQQDADSRYRDALAYRYRLEQSAAAYASNQERLARSEADAFLLRLAQYRQARARNPMYLRQLWQEERNRLLTRLQETGQLAPLDRYLGPDGLDITEAPLAPRQR